MTLADLRKPLVIRRLLFAYVVAVLVFGVSMRLSATFYCIGEGCPSLFVSPLSPLWGGYLYYYDSAVSWADMAIELMVFGGVLLIPVLLICLLFAAFRVRSFWPFIAPPLVFCALWSGNWVWTEYVGLPFPRSLDHRMGFWMGLGVAIFGFLAAPTAFYYLGWRIRPVAHQ